MTKQNGKRFLIEQAIKNIAANIVKEQAGKKEVNLDQATELAEEKVAEYATKSVMQYLARSASKKRLEDAG